MPRIRAEDPLAEADVVRLREPVRRLFARSDCNEHEVEDLTQETLLRVWEARGRVDKSVAESYALAAGRNLLVSRQRQLLVHRRHAHRLFDPGDPGLPDEAALRREEQEAAAATIAVLPPADRALLAAEYGSVPSAGARPAGQTSRIARARSRARVDYLLAVRRLALPSQRCRTVLESLSAGDRRGQERVAAGRHLRACPTCSACAPALLERRRDLCGLLPLPVLLTWHALRQAAARRPATTATAATLAALTSLVAALLLSRPTSSALPQLVSPASAASVPPGAVTAPDRPPPTPPAAPAAPPSPPAAPPGTAASPVPGTVVTAGQLLLPVGVDNTRAVGTRAVGTSVPVESVPADEGFWVGNRQARLWIQLRTRGESGATIRPGQVVSFSGIVTSAPAGISKDLTVAHGRDELLAKGFYISVAAADLTQR